MNEQPHPIAIYRRPNSGHLPHCHNVPELHRAGGYPFAVVLMAVVCTSLYVVFKKKDWL
ncbi:hypothetical protein ACGFYZ_29810 [Streptomyces sp. NPDC048330]|uniref:hypothetical protein n=1 Tax=Streptomyces sp. NPDC048330 TaxID=3365533 RepID=UPI0037145EA7